MKNYVAIAILLMTATRAYAAPLQEGQLEWAHCSWKIFDEYGLKHLQEKVVFGNSQSLSSAEYEKWEDFDIRMVDSVCGDSLKIFSHDPGARYEALRQTHTE